MKKSLYDLYEKTHYKFGTSASEFYRFLICFNQDTESFDQGLREIIMGCSNNSADPNKNEIKSVIKGIEDFLLNKDYDDEEKNNFVQQSVDLAFSDIGTTPLEWLKEVALPELKKSL